MKKRFCLKSKIVLGVVLAAVATFGASYTEAKAEVVIEAQEPNAITKVQEQDEAWEISVNESGEPDYTDTLQEMDIDEEEPESVYIFGEDDENAARELSLNEEADALPSRFVPDFAKLSKLRNQGAYGTCWAHASTFCIETTMVQDFGENPETIDYSELALAYFAAHYVTDPLGGTAGDVIENKSDKGWLYGGGNAIYAARLLASWMGSTSETEAPDTAYSNAAKVYTDGLDPKYAYMDAAHLNTYYRINRQDIDAIKSVVRKHGAIAASYYAIGSMSEAISKGYYSEENNCFYEKEHTTTNHAIAIVGWDDDFDKTKFNPLNQPANNGAWLVRNSWYTSGDMESFYGYFWMSYEEASLSAQFTSMIGEKSDNYDHCYQYDGVPASGYLSADNTFKAANVFTAKAYEKGEKIEAVGFETNSSNVTATAEIYLNPAKDNPMDGYKVGRGSVETTYPGHYTIVLDEPVYMGEGDTYSVVVTVKKDGLKPTIGIETAISGWFTTQPTILPGQSFAYDASKNSWVDCVQFKGNVRIKALSSNVTAEEEDLTKQYNIIYNLNGGINNENNPKCYRKSSPELFLLDPVSEEGLGFEGWYLDEEFDTPFESIPEGSTGDINVYAKWSEGQYYIEFNGNGHTSGEVESELSYDFGRGFKLPKNGFKRKGYSFTGWNTKKNGTGEAYADRQLVKNLASKKDETVTLYAQWKKNKYTIKYKLNGGKNNSKNKTSYYVTSKTFGLKNPTRKGYVFAGWYKDSKYTKKISQITKGSAGNLTLYAKWKKPTYIVFFDGNGGTANVRYIECKYGKSYSLDNVRAVRPGYRLKCWYKIQDGKGSYYPTKGKIKNLSKKDGDRIVFSAVWEYVGY